MLKNFLTPKNLRWLTVYLFLLLMVLLLALNLFSLPSTTATTANFDANCYSFNKTKLQRPKGIMYANAIANATLRQRHRQHQHIRQHRRQHQHIRQHLKGLSKG